MSEPKPDMPEASELHQGDSSTSNKSTKQKKQPRKPLTFGQLVAMFICGGQLVYIIVGDILMTATNKLFDAETCKRIDNLGLSSDSALLPLVHSIQFGVRTVVFGASLVALAGFGFISLVVLSTAAFGYFWLQTPNGGDITVFLKHRYDISAPFFLGIALGVAIKDGYERSSFINSYLPSFPVVAHLLMVASATLTIGAWQISTRWEKEAAKKRDKEQNAIAAALKETKVGTMQVDGGDVQDVTAGDLLKAVKTAAQTDAERLANWSKERNLISTGVARAVCGVTYGLALRFCVALLHEFAWPVVSNMWDTSGSSRSSLVGWWLYGMREAAIAAAAAGAQN